MSCAAEATSHSPSAEAVGVGKAELWLTTFRTTRWKRTKRPTDFDAMLKPRVVPEEDISRLCVVCFPPPEEEVLNAWTAPLRCAALRSGRPLVLILPRRLRPGYPLCQTHRGGEGPHKSPLCTGAVDEPRC